MLLRKQAGPLAGVDPPMATQPLSYLCRCSTPVSPHWLACGMLLLLRYFGYCICMCLVQDACQLAMLMEYHTETKTKPLQLGRCRVVGATNPVVKEGCMILLRVPFSG